MRGARAYFRNDNARVGVGVSNPLSISRVQAYNVRVLLLADAARNCAFSRACIPIGYRVILACFFFSELVMVCEWMGRRMVGVFRGFHEER